MITSASKYYYKCQHNDVTAKQLDRLDKLGVLFDAVTKENFKIIDYTIMLPDNEWNLINLVLIAIKDCYSLRKMNYPLSSTFSNELFMSNLSITEWETYFLIDGVELLKTYLNSRNKEVLVYNWIKGVKTNNLIYFCKQEFSNIPMDWEISRYMDITHPHIVPLPVVCYKFNFSELIIPFLQNIFNISVREFVKYCEKEGDKYDKLVAF